MERLTIFRDWVLSIVMTGDLSTLIYKLTWSPLNSQQAFLFKEVSSCMWKFRTLTNDQNNLEKEETNWKASIIWFQNLLRSYCMEPVLRTDIQTYRQTNRVEAPETKHLHFWSLDFKPRCQGNSMGSNVFSINGTGTIRYPQGGKMNLTCCFTAGTKVTRNQSQSYILRVNP